MPVSPADAADLARAVAQLYERAEATLLTLMRRQLAAGLESPRWTEDKLAALGNLRTGALQVLASLERDATGALHQALATAYQRGRQAAVAELGALPEGARRFADNVLPNAPSLDRLAAAWVAEQQPVYVRILRAVLDAYRTVVARASGSVLLGAQTRRQAAQSALDQFAGQGISGFTDRAGRSWEMASYAEMATRTATGRAAVDGHLDRLASLGQDLVIVSSAPLECPLCAPWEGKVLTIGGATGAHTLQVPDALQDGQTRTVHVAGSVEEARAAGLFHPNCRHSLSLYLAGVTTVPKSPPHPGGATYDDTQRQRYLERKVREWKRRQAAALDDQAQQLAGARVRGYQARIRQLTTAKDLPRRPAREQIGRAR